MSSVTHIDESYLTLRKYILNLGIKNEEEIENLIEQLDTVSNLLIDLFLESKNEKSNNLL